MKIVMEDILGIIYKLRMTEVPISVSSHIYDNNMLVIRTTQRPECTLKIRAILFFIALFMSLFWWVIP